MFFFLWQNSYFSSLTVKAVDWSPNPEKHRWTTLLGLLPYPFLLHRTGKNSPNLPPSRGTRGGRGAPVLAYRRALLGQLLAVTPTAGCIPTMYDEEHGRRHCLRSETVSPRVATVAGRRAMSAVLAYARISNFSARPRWGTTVPASRTSSSSWQHPRMRVGYCP
jgi:hypothetical protein